MATVIEQKVIVEEKVAVEKSQTYSDAEDEKIQAPFKKSPEEKAYLRKLNKRVLPITFLIIFVQFCDKAGVSVGPVLGLNQDLHLTGSQFSWLGSIFYLGFLVFQVPNQFILQRVPHGKYLGVLLFCWGMVMTFTCFARTFQVYMVMRFLLGLFEAASMPALYMITAALYRRSEQSAVFGFITLSNGVGSAIGSTIAYGIAHMGHPQGWMNWRWSQIIFGGFTIVVAFITFFFLPDTPYSPILRLTEAEKAIVADRVKDNAVVKQKEFKFFHIYEALGEIRYYALALAVLGLSFQNGGMLVYSTTFAIQLGFSILDSLLLQIPSGFSSAFGVLLAVYLARRSKQVILSAMFMTCIAIIGCIVLLAIPRGGVKLLGYYLTWCGTGAYALIVTIVGNNVSGYTKKIFYNSTIMVMYTLGNFAGPLMMKEHQAPRYLGGIAGYLAGFVVTLIGLLIIRTIMDQTNKIRHANPPTEETDVHLDLTDKQDGNFIYRL